MRRATLSHAELERRKPVWTAFSEFWLDTELTNEDLARISRVAANSRYSVEELRENYLYEVAPVVGPNLLTVAGEWAYFDEEWLHAEARRRAEHRSPWLRFRILARIGRALMVHATERHWRRIVSLLTIDSSKR